MVCSDWSTDDDDKNCGVNPWVFTALHCCSQNTRLRLAHTVLLMCVQRLLLLAVSSAYSV